MPISRKIRFEVFKRDGFRCCYCGKTPPEIVLEVDHIDPKSKGGCDDINNLISSCFDCNRGKRDIPLDKIPSTLVDNLEVLKEKEVQIKQYRKFVAKIQKRLNQDSEDIANIFNEIYPRFQFKEQFIRFSLQRFLKVLPKEEVTEAMYLAVSKRADNPDECLRYFCGVCWNKIRNGCRRVPKQ